MGLSIIGSRVSREGDKEEEGIMAHLGMEV